MSTERVTHMTSSTIAVTRIDPDHGQDRARAEPNDVLVGHPPRIRWAWTAPATQPCRDDERRAAAPVCSVTRAPEAVFGVTVSFAAVTTTSL